MRLIDADKITFIDCLAKTGNSVCCHTEGIVSKEGIDVQPTVDAVEVVRCKDCKWWKTNYMWNGSERKVCVIETYEPVRNEGDYCSRGERRENETR